MLLCYDLVMTIITGIAAYECNHMGHAFTTSEMRPCSSRSKLVELIREVESTFYFNFLSLARTSIHFFQCAQRMDCCMFKMITVREDDKDDYNERTIRHHKCCVVVCMLA